MLTSEKVYEMAAKMNADKQEEKPAEVVETKESETKAEVEETKVETAENETANSPKKEENADTDTPKEEVKDEAKPDNSNEKVVAENDASQENVEKKEPSKQEKIDYAFKKEKAKRKRLEQRIRELEEENKKYKDNLKLEDFGNKTEDYYNYLVDKKFNEKEQERLREEYSLSRQEEYNAINEQRVNACFPDENSKNVYNNLIQKQGPAFVKELDEEDPDQVVLGYLDDCDVAPLMIQILMTNDQYKNQVLSKHSPYMKLRALEDLENRIKYAQAEMAKRNSTVPEKNEDTKPVETPKPAIPVVGSVTKSDQSNGKVVNDYNAILHQLNARRYG